MVVAPNKLSAVFASPKLIVALLLLNAPAKLKELGAVATKPPVKLKLSVALLPNCKLPWLPKVVVPPTW